MGGCSICFFSIPHLAAFRKGFCKTKIRLFPMAIVLRWLPFSFCPALQPKDGGKFPAAKGSIHYSAFLFILQTGIRSSELRNALALNFHI